MDGTVVRTEPGDLGTVVDGGKSVIWHNSLEPADPADPFPEGVSADGLRYDDLGRPWTEYDFRVHVVHVGKSTTRRKRVLAAQRALRLWCEDRYTEAEEARGRLRGVVQRFRS